MQHLWSLLTILSFCKLHNLAYIYNLCYISVTAAPALLWLLEILQFQRAGAPLILVLNCLLGPSSLLNIFHSSSFSFQPTAEATVYLQCVASSPIPWNFNLPPFIFTVPHFFPLFSPSFPVCWCCFPALCQQQISLAHLLLVPRSLIKIFNKISLLAIPGGALPVTSIHSDPSFNAASPFTSFLPFQFC